MLQYLLILLIFLLVPLSMGADIYKWVDEKGTIHFSDNPSAGSKAMKVPLAPQPGKESIDKPQQGDQKSTQHPQLQEVSGTVALGFVPTVLANLPAPPIELTLVIKPQAGGAEIRHKIADSSPGWSLESSKERQVAVSHQNFSLQLSPGIYEISTLEVQAPSLSDTEFSLPTGGPNFTVPERNCVYVGRMSFVFLRLPPGSFDQSRAWAALAAQKEGKSILFVYLPKGTLVLPASTSVDTPRDTEQTQGVNGSKQLLAKASAKKCTVQLARF